MYITLNIHKQIRAKDIYVTGEEWKALYGSFEAKPKNHGIYFYTYDDSQKPFYIGQCVSNSYNILGRVWEELDDYKKGKYWFCKNPELYKTLACFKKDFPSKGFLKPNSFSHDKFKDAINDFFEKVLISFSYLVCNNSSTLEQRKVIDYIEALLQDQIVKEFNLAPNWIGDGGKKLKNLLKLKCNINFNYQNPDYIEIHKYFKK